MKRRAIQLAVLLALGAIVNVAVSWTSAVFSLGDLPNERYGTRYLDYSKSADGGVTLTVTSLRSTCMRQVEWIIADESLDAYLASKARAPWLHKHDPFLLAPSWSDMPSAEELRHYLDTSDYWRIWHIAEAHGWPWLALVVRAEGFDNIEKIQYGIALPEDLRRQPSYRPELRALPLLPIWPGFAINTIFYAVILWVLFFLPGQLKRTRRRRRGLCPACAYPIGTSPTCTECGTAIGNALHAPVSNSNDRGNA